MAMTIGTVAEITRLSVHTIRVWERRYCVVSPTRTLGGQRIYSNAQLAYLQSLAGLVQVGYRISQLVTLSEIELESLRAGAQFEQSTLRASQSLGTQPDCSGIVKRLIDCLDDYDLVGLANALNLAGRTYATRELVLKIFVPLLQQIGVLVARKSFSIAQEHCASAILRSQLSQIIFDKACLTSHCGARKAPVLAFATSEGDHHELGILLAACLALARGAEIRYFGTNLPATAYASAAKALSVDLAVVGFTGGAAACPVKSQLQYMTLLNKALPSRTAIYFGGRCEVDPSFFSGPRSITYFATLDAFDESIADLITARRISPQI